MLARVRYAEPFSPVLFSSPALPVSEEQVLRISDVIDVASSDSQFALKLKKAILYILTNGNTVLPQVTSLSPNTVVLGSPSFDIHVMGSGFTPTSVIVFAGNVEPTTFVSDKELTTGVNMDVWLGPDSVPVAVQNEDGTMSSAQMFTFTSAAVQSASTQGVKLNEGRSTKK